MIRGHQASHDFQERQNCSPPQTPITVAMPLGLAVMCWSRSVKLVCAGPS